MRVAYFCHENFRVDAEPEDVLQKLKEKYLRDRCHQSHIFSTQALWISKKVQKRPALLPNGVAERRSILKKISKFVLSVFCFYFQNRQEGPKIGVSFLLTACRLFHYSLLTLSFGWNCFLRIVFNFRSFSRKMTKRGRVCLVIQKARSLIGLKEARSVLFPFKVVWKRSFKCVHKNPT